MEQNGSGDGGDGRVGGVGGGGGARQWRWWYRTVGGGVNVEGLWLC